jgi:hypothetical protein
MATAPGAPTPTQPPAPARRPPTPRWVTVLGVLALVVLVVLLVARLVGGAEHGPGRHAGGHTDRGTVSATWAAMR